jgi:hypothetical protein
MRLNRLVRLVGAVAIGTAGLSATGIGALGLVGGPSIAGAASCTTLSNGLTALEVANTPGEVFSGPTYDATGCDVGIYVPAGITGVAIGGASPSAQVTVTGANDTGILAEGTSDLTVENTTVSGNGVAPTKGVTSFGGIVLAGVSDSQIGSTANPNTVINNGGGGILVNDNGAVDPAAPNPGTGPPVPSTDDTVSGNTINANYGSCAIVYATHNMGGAISGGVISDNVITGHPGVFKTTGPDLGGIVVAAASVGATVTGTQVTANQISNSFEGGIIVHSHAPNDVVTGTTITDNTVGPNNNWGATNGPPTTAGIIVGVDLLPPAIAPKITATTVANNSISGQFYGLWISGVPLTEVTTTPANQISTLTGGTAIYTTPAPGSGYWQVASDGGVFTYGTAGFYGSAGSIKLNKPIVGMTSTQDQGGYWLVASDGGIFNYGDAGFFGSHGGTPLNQPIVGMAATPYVPGANGAPASPAGLGYWLVAADGGIFTYGDAGFYGSTGGMHLNKPIVGMTPTPDGKGYWLVASDGGVFSFGDATFFGSAGSIKLNQPVVGMAATPDGKGYWLVASDGGIFSYGDATFFGSAGSIKLNQPVVGISATPDGKGYWLNAADGGIFNYGDATFFGSAGNIKLNKPMVGISSVGTTFSG